MEFIYGLLIAIIGALSGSVTAMVSYRLKRKEDAEKDESAMHRGMKLTLMDITRRRTQEAVAAGEVSISEKAYIHELVDAAHALGANGEMTACAEEIDKLRVI